MQLSEIAKDLAQKAVVSRTLGGVIKAGQYADWANDYKTLAAEHYAELEQQKTAEATATPDAPAPGASAEGMPSLLRNALIGGGIGLGAGALGGLFSGGKLKNKLRKALSYGLLGGLGGAGVGVGGTLLADKDSIKQLTGMTSGDTPEIQNLRNAVNAKGLGSSTVAGNVAGLSTLVPAGAVLGHKAQNKLKQLTATTPKAPGVPPTFIDRLKRKANISLSRPKNLLSGAKGGGMLGAGAVALSNLLGENSDASKSKSINEFVTNAISSGEYNNNPAAMQALQKIKEQTTSGLSSWIPTIGGPDVSQWLPRWRGVSSQDANRMIDEISNLQK